MQSDKQSMALEAVEWWLGNDAVRLPFLVLEGLDVTTQSLLKFEMFPLTLLNFQSIESRLQVSSTRNFG